MDPKKNLIVLTNQIELNLKWHSSSQCLKLFEDIIYVHTLGEAVPTSHHWPLGDAILGLNPSGLGVYIPPSQVESPQPNNLWLNLKLEHEVV